jgi:hypothetical protein
MLSGAAAAQSKQKQEPGRKFRLLCHLKDDE